MKGVEKKTNIIKDQYRTLENKKYILKTKNTKCIQQLRDQKLFSTWSRIITLMMRFIPNKNGVYMLSCGEYDKTVYLGETGRKIMKSFPEHKSGENDGNTNSLYARHFVEKGH